MITSRWLFDTAPLSTMDDYIKTIGDVMAGSISLAVVLAWAPVILGVPSAIYAILRTIQLLQNWKKK